MKPDLSEKACKPHYDPPKSKVIVIPNKVIDHDVEAKKLEEMTLGELRYDLDFIKLLESPVEDFVETKKSNKWKKTRKFFGI